MYSAVLWPFFFHSYKTQNPPPPPNQTCTHLWTCEYKTKFPCFCLYFAVLDAFWDIYFSLCNSLSPQMESTPLATSWRQADGTSHFTLSKVQLLTFSLTIQEPTEILHVVSISLKNCYNNAPSVNSETFMWKHGASLLKTTSCPLYIFFLQRIHAHVPQLWWQQSAEWAKLFDFQCSKVQNRCWPSWKQILGMLCFFACRLVLGCTKLCLLMCRISRNTYAFLRGKLFNSKS